MCATEACSASANDWRPSSPAIEHARPSLNVRLPGILGVRGHNFSVLDRYAAVFGLTERCANLHLSPLFPEQA